MTISTTITKKNFEMKMQDLTSDGFFVEYKEIKPFWTKRIRKLFIDGLAGNPLKIVLLVGSQPHKYIITDISYTKDIPEKYKPAVHTEYAYALKCVPCTALR